MKPENARSVKELIASNGSSRRIKFVHFWGHTPRPDGQISAACFSQWYAAPFSDGSHEYPTAEHYMMAEKARLFDDNEQLTKILEARSPGAAKAAGRAVLKFDNDIWMIHRFEIVVRANELKFGQNPVLGAFLQSTEKRVIVEASPQDRIWGIGLAQDHEHADVPSKWRGLNLLGFALMEARTRLGLSTS